MSKENDCRNCMHGWIDDQLGIPFCHCQDTCQQWDLWEPKDEQREVVKWDG